MKWRSYENFLYLFETDMWYLVYGCLVYIYIMCEILFERQQLQAWWKSESFMKNTRYLTYTESLINVIFNNNNHINTFLEVETCNRQERLRILVGTGLNLI